MKLSHLRKSMLIILICALAFAILNASPVFAAGEAPDWRPTYDVIMMWVNFLILAGVLYKVLKNPISDFIQGKKYEMEKEIQNAEDQKIQAEEKIKESMKMLAEGKDKFVRVKERIIAQGEKNKETIIAEAREQSKYMMAEAKRKVDSQIIRARENFRKELVDMAFDIVIERLPSEINEDDNIKLTENYISTALPG